MHNWSKKQHDSAKTLRGHLDITSTSDIPWLVLAHHGVLSSRGSNKDEAASLVALDWCAKEGGGKLCGGAARCAYTSGVHGLGGTTLRYLITYLERWRDQLSRHHKGTYRNSRAYFKFRKMLDQAKQDGLDYAWIDSCCIDKSSSAELSESINSMFRWYRDAAVCYAYLEDVTDVYELGRGSAFANSRWFERGWTLQELIAPKDVHFYDASGNFISRRQTISRSLAEIIRVGEELLKDEGNTSVSRYSIAQRMSWASSRRTTREEDEAYCLMGLFDVSMPLLYREGHRAFQRLQEEIIKQSTDLSIFAWDGNFASDSLQARQLLAPSARGFERCGDIVTTRNVQNPEDVHVVEAMLTNVGLRITASLLVASDERTGDTGLAILLNSQNNDNFTKVLALKVHLATGSDHRDLNEALKQTKLNCRLGWPASMGRHKLVLVDALEAAEESVTKDIVVKTTPEQNDFHAIGSKRDWTYLWVRFSKGPEDRRWTTIDVFPRNFWHSADRYFDLEAARSNKIRYGDSQSAESRSVFGLPIHGAIALQQEDVRIAIFFCQKTTSLQDGLVYSITHYDEQNFGSIPHHLQSPCHLLELANGTSLKLTLHVAELSDKLVAHMKIVVVESGIQQTDGVAHEPIRSNVGLGRSSGIAHASHDLKEFLIHNKRKLSSLYD